MNTLSSSSSEDSSSSSSSSEEESSSPPVTLRPPVVLSASCSPPIPSCSPSSSCSWSRPPSSREVPSRSRDRQRVQLVRLLQEEKDVQEQEQDEKHGREIPASGAPPAQPPCTGATAGVAIPAQPRGMAPPHLGQVQVWLARRATGAGDSGARCNCQGKLWV